MCIRDSAQGVALAARRLGCEAVIVMPVTTPAIKVDAVRRLGGQVVLFGESFSDAWPVSYTHLDVYKRQVM